MSSSHVRHEIRSRKVLGMYTIPFVTFQSQCGNWHRIFVKTRQNDQTIQDAITGYYYENIPNMISWTDDKQIQYATYEK